MATRTDVAKLANVSSGTVSNVFNGKDIVSEDTKRRVLEAAEKLKYVPNRVARSLSLGRTNHIGIAVNEMTNLYHMEIICAIEKYAMKHGYIVTVFDLNFDMKITMDNIEQLGLDALINFTTIDYNKRCIEMLFERGTVLVNFGLNIGMNFEIDSEEAISEIMRKIAEYGHKKVGFVCTIDEMRFKVDVRARTMMRLRRELGFCKDEDLVAYASDMSETSERTGYNGCMELMKRRPDLTCLMLTNDMSAVGAIRALKNLGLSVPRDISVVGFDGIRLAELLVPSVTTVSFDKDAYGKMIAEKVIKYIENKKSCVGKNYVVKAFPVFGESLARRKNG